MSKEVSTYLLEIGTEEIPARFIPGALAQMREIVSGALSKHGIPFSGIKVLGTPRRLTLVIEGLALKGDDQLEEIRGPAKKAAYDSEGRPTKALLGFMGAQGVSLEDLTVREINNNEYVFASKLRIGQNAADALPDILKAMVADLSFPKFMRWADLDFRFVRPIRWVVSLLGDEVLPLSLAGVDAGRQSRGHRYLSEGAVEIRTASDYEDALLKAFVIADPSRRKELIRHMIDEIAEKNACVAPEDEELLDEVTYLLEWPTALIGKFDPAYLEIPEEVVITPMREHQRYFPVRDARGKLINRFITLRDGNDRRLDLVTEGNERVLEARLSDARFFWDEDRKQSLEAYLPKLDKVVFHEKLGSVGDKRRRVESLSAWIADALDVDADAKSIALRGAMLAKADLVTNMVYEFAELQGIMGRYYAMESGERPEVAAVITEHYQPRFAGDKPAESLPGAIVAIADKMDTIAGIFSIGIEPTGSQDPYAIRRAAMGVCQTLLAHDMRISMSGLLWRALESYGIAEGASEAYARVREFIEARVRNILSDEGHRFDVIDSAISAPYEFLREVMERARAISRHREDASFKSLVAGFTRAYNLTIRSAKPEILKPEVSATSAVTTRNDDTRVKVAFEMKVDPASLTEETELSLYASLLSAREAIDDAFKREGYSGVIRVLSGLAAPVNAFFDSVMVMADDEAVRENRLGLLREVVSLTRAAGDLSKLQD